MGSVTRRSRRGVPALATAAVLAGALLLAGCKSEVYSGLSERDAQEIIVALSNAGIAADRVAGDAGKYSIEVDRSQLSAAITELTNQGLPRQKYGSLGDVFSSDKLVSTPFEERARFMYALNEELAASINQIAGVVSARVHLMVPETTPFEKTAPRASVFIYKAPGSDLSAIVPTIKNLVVNSMDGLKYEDVEVAIFDAAQVTGKPAITMASRLGGIATTVLMILGLAGLALFALTRVKAMGRAPRIAPGSPKIPLHGHRE
ncbi:EscJ/YscJ/HrcJ family type III secretion inner membrane ring protein [Zhengella mangrovi]|uniref:Lipoprotein n=1 Tax=Zhengella mangrovi TaxID=1982044 RepID=A0A2G1QLZ4_9HYPH|nr:type III secretion inner membrane ring lipoprotein SctJ [Zhengella mangrovi]PHP66481.1 EscJ/YscJ/HrcJ family type III secretion inner membrane ring protein [Zhengella mangrovi]